MNKKSLLVILVLYIASAGLTFGGLQLQAQTSSTVIVPETGTDDETALGELLQIDPKEPRDQVCPLNGKLYTNSEKVAWEKKRPLAVMIENTPDSRPQSGLS
ncbi:MAG: DUF3048 domain-containing protein, partial [bacterium]|nr:DUF3048 domain-containing protein [bacterium]